MEQIEKAALLRGYHHSPPILVLPNAWDVASAIALAGVPGVRALATTSAAVARSRGYEDGEQAPRDEMVDAAGRIARAVEIPVTADLEAGYGDPAGTARLAWDAGIVGMNFEDSPGGLLRDYREQAELIREIKAAVPHLVLNARVDVFEREAGGVEEAVERANAYLAAGADSTYPLLCPNDVIGELVRRINGPVNVLLYPGVPEPSELEKLGVARVTWGGRLASIAYAEAVRVAALAYA